MVTRRISLTLAALVGIGLAIGRSAGAQTIVQTFPIPTQSTPFSDMFTFNKFDSTVGILNTVTVELSTSITATIEVINNTSSAVSFFGAQASIPVTATGPAGITITQTATSTFAGPAAAPPGDSFYGGTTATNDNIVNVPQASFIPGYEGVGPGTGSISVAALNGSYGGFALGSLGSGGGFTGVATAFGTLTITYKYFPAGSIPEPGTTTFLAAGVLGSFGMVLRRRRRA